MGKELIVSLEFQMDVPFLCPFCYSCSALLFFFFFLICFLGLHLQHMEVPRLRVELELAYTTATAMHDLNCLCNLHHSWQQHQILNPLSEARDWTCVLMDTNQIHFFCATMGTPRVFFLILTATSWSGLRILHLKKWMRQTSGIDYISEDVC